MTSLSITDRLVAALWRFPGRSAVFARKLRLDQPQLAVECRRVRKGFVLTIRIKSNQNLIQFVEHLAGASEQLVHQRYKHPRFDKPRDLRQ